MGKPLTDQPLTPERQQLVVSHLKLAYWVAKRYDHRRDPEETAGVALLALCRAAAHFDFGRGLKFMTYAYRFIWGTLLSHGRDEVGRPLSLEAAREATARDDEGLRRFLARDEVAGLLARIGSPRQREALTLLVEHDMDAAAAASAMGLSTSSVREYLSRTRGSRQYHAKRRERDRKRRAAS